MAKATEKQQSSRQENPPRGGMPGDGAGRVENPGAMGKGVFPASAGPSGHPELHYQGMASFGQGERGAAGYQDSGRSEVFTMPPGDVPAAPAARKGGVGEPGSNAGEVNPGVGGSGETTGEAQA